jgi:hypothetical protein
VLPAGAGAETVTVPVDGEPPTTPAGPRVGPAIDMKAGAGAGAGEGYGAGAACGAGATVAVNARVTVAPWASVSCSAQS